MSYLDSGFNENLVRNQYPSEQQYDNANIGELIGNGSTIPFSGVNVPEGAIGTDMLANLIIEAAKIADGAVTDTKIVSMAVGKLLAGTITVAANLGGANVLMDGVNKRIVINDGTNDRILIGYLAGKF